MKGHAVRDLYESFKRSYTDIKVANSAFTDKVVGLMKKDSNGKAQISQRDMSFKDLWEALVVSQDLEENLTSSAFPSISSEIISSAMIEAYQEWPKVGLGLVRVVPSKLKVSLVPGWKAIGTIRQVTEKEDYIEVIPPDEKTVTIKNSKYGGLLSLTKEDIFFDRTGQLIDRAREIGMEAARFQDQLIMEGVIDKNATVYTPSTGVTALYASGNSNLNTGAGSVLGSAGFEASYIKLLKKTDEQSKKIWVLSDVMQVMVPPDLWPTADKLLRNEYEVAGTAMSTTANFARGKFMPIVNPYQTVTTRWHMGNFKKQFRWEEVWPLETYSRVGQDSEDGFKRDVIQSYKCSLFGGVGADDFKYVEQNNGV